jgi:hypothetical protein
MDYGEVAITVYGFRSSGLAISAEQTNNGVCLTTTHIFAHPLQRTGIQLVSFKLPSVHDYMYITSSAGIQLNHDENLIQTIREVRSLHCFELIERLHMNDP